VREKFTCRECEKITQPPALFHVTPRGFAGPNLLAMILFEKFAQHQPLNRQSERYAREGGGLLRTSSGPLPFDFGVASGTLQVLPLTLMTSSHDTRRPSFRTDLKGARGNGRRYGHSLAKASLTTRCVGVLLVLAKVSS
jgi:hypothetical protein